MLGLKLNHVSKRGHWCQATSHYQSQCWPRSRLPYGVTRPQWVNSADEILQIIAALHVPNPWLTGFTSWARACMKSSRQICSLSVASGSISTLDVACKANMHDFISQKLPQSCTNAIYFLLFRVILVWTHKCWPDRQIFTYQIQVSFIPFPFWWWHHN